MNGPAHVRWALSARNFNMAAAGMLNRFVKFFRNLLAGLIAMGMLLLGSAAHAQVRFVDITMTSATGDGESWPTAYKYLQDALKEATGPGGESITEIWVADGTYYPDDTAAGAIGGRSASFKLREGVRIMGGFAGDETDKYQRDVFTNIATLSGDIDQDDTGSTPGSNNSYHVVIAENVNNTAIIDGFVITRGYAIDAPRVAAHLPESAGAGGGMAIYITNSSDASTGANPAVLRCTFEKNSAEVGGAVMVSGMQLARPVFQNCRFRDNKAYQDAFLNWGYGGAVVVFDETFTTVQFVNCLFHDNNGEAASGAIRAGELSLLKVYNCTFSQNSSGAGAGAIAHEAPYDPVPKADLVYGTHLVSSILWDNTGPQGEIWGARHISYSCVEGYADGDIVTNIGWLDEHDPDFVAPSTNDFHLICATSPCRNKGYHLINPDTGFPDEDSDHIYVGLDPYDLDQDGSPNNEETPDLDLKRRDRNVIDMGCYEAFVPERCSGDVNEDKVVNVTDLLLVIGDWGACPGCLGDVYPGPCVDGTVNVQDLLETIRSWGTCEPTEPPDNPTDAWHFCLYICETAEDPQACVPDCLTAIQDEEAVSEWIQYCVDTYQGKPEDILDCIRNMPN